MKLGMIKTHKILKFKQCHWMKPCITIIVKSYPVCKKTNTQTNRERMIKDVCLLYKGPAQFNEKNLMQLSVVSAKSLRTLKFLPKIFLNTDIMDLYLLLCSFILFKSKCYKSITIRSGSWQL